MKVLFFISITELGFSLLLFFVGQYSVSLRILAYWLDKRKFVTSKNVIGRTENL